MTIEITRLNTALFELERKIGQKLDDLKEPSDLMELGLKKIINIMDDTRDEVKRGSAKLDRIIALLELITSTIDKPQEDDNL